MQIFQRGTGKFKLSTRLKRNRSLAVGFKQSDNSALILNCLPVKFLLHAGKQSGNSIVSIIRDRFKTIRVEPEFFVFGPNPPFRLGLAAFFKPFNELMIIFNRAGICGVACHDKISQLDGLGEAFRRAGLAHFLAISGLHLGVMAGFVLMVARLGGRHRRWHGQRYRDQYDRHRCADQRRRCHYRQYDDRRFRRHL